MVRFSMPGDQSRPDGEVATRQWERLALLSGLIVVLIWSGWIVLSRHGVQTRLTPADITLLRFATAAVCTLPWSLRYPWHRVPLGRALVVALGCGFPYTLFSFYGMTLSPAANVGVVVNGTMPIISGLLAVWLLRQRLRWWAWLGVAMIVGANALMIVPQLLQHHVPWSAIALLLGASTVMSIYLTAVKYWQVTIREILAWVPLINALICLPLWWWMPHNLFDANRTDIALQMVYQGVVVSVLALFLLGFTVRVLGSLSSALFMALVPTVTALMAIPLLAEWPTGLQWAGILGCSLGLALYGYAQQPLPLRPATLSVDAGQKPMNSGA